MEAVFPYDPTRDDPVWTGFVSRFEKRFAKKPEAFASLAFDAMNILLDAVCLAGLNRGLIRDALAARESYKGVTGEMAFDPNSKNIVPMYLATVRDGRIQYRRYGMEKPYAETGEGEVAYAGPPIPDLPAGPLRFVVFGNSAAQRVATQEMRQFERWCVLAPVDAEKPWGHSSRELVDQIYGAGAAGIIAVGRNASHLAEQLAAKSFVPLIAISSDSSLTAVNVPWVFRLDGGATLEEAVRTMAEAAAKSGPNRQRLRDALAASGRFDRRGEPR
jgi:hypothetical protein